LYCAVHKKLEHPIMPDEEATNTVSFEISKNGGFLNAKNSIKKIKI